MRRCVQKAKLAKGTNMLDGTRVLVVEPEYLIALEIQRILSDRGADALGALTFADASAALVDRRFDLAIVALDPQGHGLDFCRALLQAGVAVVLVSSAAEHGSGHRDLPGAMIVAKPFGDDDLLAAVTAALTGTCGQARGH